MKNPVRAHETRLRAVFQRALLLALAPAAALQACSDDTVVGAAGADAGDATTASDVTTPDQTSPEAEPGMADAGDAGASDGPVAREGASDALTDAGAFDAVDGDDGPSDAPSDAADEGEDANASTPWCADASAGAPWWPDASGNCKYFVDLSCAQYVPVGGCLLSASDCLKVCTLNTPLFECEYAQPACTIAGRFVADAGQPLQVQCDLCPGAGRRPEGLRRTRNRHAAGSSVGAYLARAAHLEAASVHAFDRMESELLAHGAPACLAKAARRSRVDEVRHAEAMCRLALRHGARPRSPRVAPWKSRSLEGMAYENAVEGCVRETYGALVATWQAAHATDAVARRCFARIAADETRHAALAWAVAEWAESRLDARARARMVRARRLALGRLRREIAADPPCEVAAALGLPSARQARALLGVVGASGYWA